MDIIGSLLKMAEMLVDMKNLQIVERKRGGFSPTISRMELLQFAKAYAEKT